MRLVGVIAGIAGAILIILALVPGQAATINSVGCNHIRFSGVPCNNVRILGDINVVGNPADPGGLGIKVQTEDKNEILMFVVNAVNPVADGSYNLVNVPGLRKDLGDSIRYEGKIYFTRPYQAASVSYILIDYWWQKWDSGSEEHSAGWVSENVFRFNIDITYAGGDVDISQGNQTSHDNPVIEDPANETEETVVEKRQDAGLMCLFLPLGILLVLIAFFWR